MSSRWNSGCFAFIAVYDEIRQIKSEPVEKAISWVNITIRKHDLLQEWERGINTCWYSTCIMFVWEDGVIVITGVLSEPPIKDRRRETWTSFKFTNEMTFREKIFRDKHRSILDYVFVCTSVFVCLPIKNTSVGRGLWKGQKAIFPLR